MREGSWNGAVSTDNVRVWVNGTLRPVNSVKINSGMRDGHPRSDTDSWCVESTIEWADPATVTADSPHLFGEVATDWLPKAGDSVVIETGDGALGQWWTQHRGMIDDTSGSIAEGTAVSTTVDDIENLMSRVQFGALLHRMTPWSDAHDYRHIGLSTMWLVDRMFRNQQNENIGWYATPPPTWETVAMATMNGSCWPEKGTLRICGRSYSDPGGQILGWSNTPYGMAPRGLYAEYLWTQGIPECVLSVAVNDLTAGGVTRYRVQGDSSYGPFIRINGPEDTIEYGIITTGTATYSVPIGSATSASLYFRRNTTTSQTLILRLDDGREFTTNTGSSAFPNGFEMKSLMIDTNDSGVAGWWMVEGVKPESQRFNIVNHFKPTARLRRNADVRLLASPDMPFTEPSGWLQEQVDAECAAMWLDEDGKMQWASRGVLDNQNPVLTITTPRDVDKIDWEQRRRALARGVWVNFDEPQVRTLLGGFRQNCWETEQIDLAPGEKEYITVNVPDDEDWISVDLNSSLMTSYMNPAQLRMGSKHGGTMYRDSATGEDQQVWAQFLDYSLKRYDDRVDPSKRGDEGSLRTFYIYYSPWSTISSNFRIKSAIPNLNDKDSRPPANINAWHSGKPAVRIRSRGITRWNGRTRSVKGGEIGQARFTHDVGWRVQDMHIVDAIGELLSFLGEVMRDSTKPWITGITIAHDPRLQIGDKIRIRDTAVTGIEFLMLVQDREIDPVTMTENIKGRVTWVSDTLVGTTRWEPVEATPTTPTRNWTREYDPEVSS